MLWYSDALSYKRFGRSMSGLVYQALPMGAVPIEYDLILGLKGIEHEFVDFGDSVGERFVPTLDKEYLCLSEEEIDVLNKIIDVFGAATKDTIVNAMHEEQAYIETAPNDIIQYKYTLQLSLD